MANYLDETGLGTLISLIKQWTLDEISASSGGGGGSLYVLPTATSSALGGVMLSHEPDSEYEVPLQMDSQSRAYVDLQGAKVDVPEATSSAFGGIKTGYSANKKNYPVVLDGEGKAYVNVPWTDPESPAEPYELPVATASVLGGVKIGAGLSVEGDGTLSALSLDVQPITVEFIDGLFTPHV